MLHLLYTQLARSRRSYYERRPHLRRRLEAPVISVGNLTVGGSGKTPLTGEIARMLVRLGERPSILSRGYARLAAVEGVVVVSDGVTIRADVAHAGDEPYMLAQMIPEAAVLVCQSRYASGRMAESQLGCTVHLLDDGFQHFQLERDIDLLVTPPEDFTDTRTLPFGRFREPVEAGRVADALLVPATDGTTAAEMSVRLQVDAAFGFQRLIDREPAGRRAFAFAGIAKPQQFFADLHDAGWTLTGRRAFRDHHQFSTRELDGIQRAAKESGAEIVLTTSKDFVRLPKQTSTAMPIVAIALRTPIDPAIEGWLAERLAKARAA